MKIILLISALLACAFCGTLQHKNGNDILSKLQGGTNEVYVVLFTAGNNKGDAIAKKNGEYEAALKGIQEKYPQFTYTTVNTADRNYDDLVDAVSIIRSELEKSPSVLIMHQGNGEWIHGPQTISKIFEFAPAYLKRISASG